MQRQRTIGIALMILMMVIGLTLTIGAVFFKDEMRALLGKAPKRGNTPLHLAVKKYDDARVRQLLQAGANVNARNDDAATPLHLAAAGARDGEPTLVKMLVDAGADVNAQDVTGMTPLHLANTGDVAEYLLAHGASTSLTTQSGVTPLHTAAARGKVRTVTLLLERGIKVNVRDNAGRTPLHYAAEFGTVETARVLLTKGAVVDDRSFDGVTPLQLATNNLPVADLLRDFGAKE